jgi:riboflavin kinase / FMN adenylyltransferase
MQIYNNLYEDHKITKEGIISIGYFDSFHLGHRKLLSTLQKIGEENNLNCYVLTYSYLPQKNKRTILDLSTRLKFIKDSGIKNLILCDYNQKFSSIRPLTFIDLLKNNFGVNNYVVGKDFYFGNEKSGNISTLKKKLCKVHVIEPEYFENKKISTSLIRSAIMKGDVEYADKLMGRNFFIEGIVNKGKQLGRTIGFPTMNIHNNELINPQSGTYVTRTYLKDTGYYSMTYVTEDIIETNLIGYSEYKYNMKIKIDFLKKIRDNVPFTGIENLKPQLFEDLSKIREYFKI